MKKSYKGLVIWLIVFIVSYGWLIILPVENFNLLTNISMLYTTGMIATLCYIIYRFDKIYWINGVMFEDAAKMTRRQRDRYTLRHFEAFGKFFCIHLIFAIIAHFFGFPLWIIITVPAIGLIAAAISTIMIKPE